MKHPSHKCLASLILALAICDVGHPDEHVLDGQMLSLAPYKDLYDGTLDSMARLSLDVSGEDIIMDIDVRVDISHTWAGNLVFKLEAPSGSIVNIMSRPGYAEKADDGYGCCGESSDLVFGNIYEFDDAAPCSSETLGSGGEDPIASVTLYSSGFMDEYGLTTLAGEEPTGTWTLYVGQADDGDTGTFDGFTLQINCNCPGQIDDDCVVGFGDLLAVLAGWGPCPPKEWCRADVDGDGTIGVHDLIAVLSGWGPC